MRKNILYLDMYSRVLREHRGVMRSDISEKAKRLTGWMALTAAVCAGALAVAVVLFFEVWWTGLIALAVSMLSGGATVLLFMAYQAQRRRSMRLTEEEEEEERIMEMLENAHSKRDEATPDTTEDSSERGRLAETEREEKTATGGEEKTAENTSLDGENVTDAGKKNANENADDSDRPTTLEMRPPLKMFTVQEAKAHMKHFDKENKNNDADDKNEG